MKCKCGNEQGSPRIKPFPIIIGGIRKGEEVEVLYAGGMRKIVGGFECWFCTFPMKEIK